MTEPWSVRQASVASGTTRALARAVVGEGLLPGDHLSDAHVVALRALASGRSLLFPGESQPANAARQTPERDRQLVAAVERLQQVGAGWQATVVLFVDRAVPIVEPLDLVRRVADATDAGECYLVLPVGRWLVQLRSVGEIATPQQAASAGMEVGSAIS